MCLYEIKFDLESTIENIVTRAPFHEACQAGSMGERLGFGLFAMDDSASLMIWKVDKSLLLLKVDFSSEVSESK